MWWWTVDNTSKHNRKEVTMYINRGNKIEIGIMKVWGEWKIYVYNTAVTE